MAGKSGPGRGNPDHHHQRCSLWVFLRRGRADAVSSCDHRADADPCVRATCYTDAVSCCGHRADADPCIHAFRYADAVGVNRRAWPCPTQSHSDTMVSHSLSPLQGLPCELPTGANGIFSGRVYVCEEL